MKILKLGLISIFIIFSLFAALYVGQYLTQDTSSSDSNALVGGEVETSYRSAGYLIAKKNAKYEYCGITNLRPGLAITAAHCVLDADSMVVGFGKFTINKESQYEVTTVIMNKGWKDSDVSKDFAVIKYNLNSKNYESTGYVSEPELGCSYRIVGYGRESSTSLDKAETKLRKSIQVCIQKIEDRLVYISGLDGGVCFGDSGSPIYKENSNSVVGIISSIITTTDSDDPCYEGNKAVAVRSDVGYAEYQSSVNETLANNEFEISELDSEKVRILNDELLGSNISIESTSIEKYFDNNTLNVILVFGATMSVFTLILLVVKIFRRA